MTDTKESMQAQGQPPEKPTVRDLEVPPAWAISMSEKMESGFRGLRADVSMVANDVGLLRDRVVVLERAKLDNDERQAKHSVGFARESKTNEEQNAAIATIITDVASVKEAQAEHGKKLDALAARPDTAAAVLEKVTELGKTPTGQKLVGAGVTVLLLALTLVGASLKMKVDAIEQKPASVQPAPTVYLPVAVPVLDGGVP